MKTVISATTRKKSPSRIRAEIDRKQEAVVKLKAEISELKAALSAAVSERRTADKAAKPKVAVKRHVGGQPRLNDPKPKAVVKKPLGHRTKNDHWLSMQKTKAGGLQPTRQRVRK